jgi:hypothetical protein
MNIEQQIEALQAQLDALREQCKKQPEFEYPLYMQAKVSKVVVKFTGLTTGDVVVVGKGCYTIYPNCWLPHTDTTNWQPITFDEERGIADKQLCECWGVHETAGRSLRFYDAKNKCAYNSYGKHFYAPWDNYHPIPSADYPEWAIEAEKTLED